MINNNMANMTNNGNNNKKY